MEHLCLPTHIWRRGAQGSHQLGIRHFSVPLDKGLSSGRDAIVLHLTDAAEEIPARIANRVALALHCHENLKSGYQPHLGSRANFQEFVVETSAYVRLAKSFTEIRTDLPDVNVNLIRNSFNTNVSVRRLRVCQIHLFCAGAHLFRAGSPFLPLLCRKFGRLGGFESSFVFSAVGTQVHLFRACTDDRVYLFRTESSFVFSAVDAQVHLFRAESSFDLFELRFNEGLALLQCFSFW